MMIRINKPIGVSNQFIMQSVGINFFPRFWQTFCCLPFDGGILRYCYYFSISEIVQLLMSSC
jgi:hypothetical protein